MNKLKSFFFELKIFVYDTLSRNGFFGFFQLLICAILGFIILPFYPFVILQDKIKEHYKRKLLVLEEGSVEN